MKPSAPRAGQRRRTGAASADPRLARCAAQRSHHGRRNHPAQPAPAQARRLSPPARSCLGAAQARADRKDGLHHRLAARRRIAAPGPDSGSTGAKRTTRSRARMVRLERSYIHAVPTDAAGTDEGNITSFMRHHNPRTLPVPCSPTCSPSRPPPVPRLPRPARERRCSSPHPCAQSAASGSSSPPISKTPTRASPTLDSTWVEQPGRLADIYIFAWHPETRERIVDHREPNSGRSSCSGPRRSPAAQRSISLARVERLARTVRAESLAPTVKQMLKRGDEPGPIHI